MKKLYEDLGQHTLRMDAVILLAGMLNDGMAISDPLLELLEDEEDDVLRRCFQDIDERVIAARDDGDDEWREAFMDWAYRTGKWGFVIQFARPVMEWSPDLRGAGFSWGYYNTTWVYGDTLAQAVARGKKLAKEREAVEKAKAKAKASLKTPNEVLTGASAQATGAKCAERASR